jgi:hypothetical protein
MKLAEAADNTPLPEDMNVSKELQRSQNLLAVIAKAKQEIQNRAKARYAQEVQLSIQGLNFIRSSFSWPSKVFLFMNYRCL